MIVRVTADATYAQASARQRRLHALSASEILFRDTAAGVQHEVLVGA